MKPFDCDCADGSSGGVTAWFASALMTAFGVVACATVVPVRPARASAVRGRVVGVRDARQRDTGECRQPQASSIFDAVPIVFCFSS